MNQHRLLLPFVSLLLSGCAFQMKMVAPTNKTIQYATADDTSCRIVGMHSFYFFDEQRMAAHYLEQIADHKKARVTVRQSVWQILLNGASFGIFNLGSLKVEECD